MTEPEAYYLIDLQRSIQNKLTTYWKANRHGYVTELSEAGLFSEGISQHEVERDFDKRTIRVAKSVVDNMYR